MRIPIKLGLVIGLTVLAALSLSGCGVRGSLEAPPEARNESGSATPGTPGTSTPNKTSILDPLIR
jgi:predicted small lipoprotein YifL